MTKRKVVLIYDESVGMSDKKAQAAALFDIGGCEKVIHFGNQTYMNEWRIAAMNGKINLSIMFNNTRIEVDENGGIDNWPTGFLDVLDKQFSILFGL